MIIRFVFFYCFVQLSLLIPGYVVVRNSRIFVKKSGLELSFAYIASLVFLGLLATIGYVFRISPTFLQTVGWLCLIAGVVVFVRQKLYRDLYVFRFPLLCFMLMSLLSCAFVSLSFPAKYSYLPDPSILSSRNYDVLNVKVLNLSQTQANDNYVPYRQAQFFINRSDPGNDCFICEWGVGFFQRTPLMGAITAGYFTVLNDKPPVDYLWSSKSHDPSHTYAKFQVLAQVLNALFIIPAFYLLSAMFKKRTAMVSCLLLIGSPFFLYNAVFSWPKSLVAFFVLVMWLLLLQKRLRYTVLAGVVGGLAYLTHDLAVFYIVASIGLLLYHRRFRDIFVLGGISALIAFPWLVVSSLIYKKPSTFALYPLSLHGLPQPGQSKAIVNEFLHTSPLEIISIRFDTLFYLLSPYDLIYSTGGQSILKRIWAVGIFSIPGSLGFGLIIPVLLGAIKRIKGLDFWILVLIPVLMAAGIVGWRGSRAIASLHFAQAVVVLLTGLGVAYLVKLNSRLWLLAAFFANTLQLLFVIFYSHPGVGYTWFKNLSNIACLGIIGGVVGVSGFMMFRIAYRKPALVVES
ncbi:MAG TPA: glycosyltransferase family 39 protein [Candidatus Saccharibacteria bacterium]|nr:glycosyltransferase family 39 protein [Candidatus Saccharibacteria bacterium]